jgi:hypothetical protein
VTDAMNDLIPRTFKSKAPEERVNAETIRRFMHDFVAHEFARNCATAADSLNALPIKVEERRGFRKNVTKSSIETATRDSQHIRYAHLDAMARYYKIPVSMILLFTRVRDELETIDQRRNRNVFRVLKSIRSLLDHVERLAEDVSRSDAGLYEVMGHDVFLSYAEVYRKEYEGSFVQHTLPLNG